MKYSLKELRDSARPVLESDEITKSEYQLIREWVSCGYFSEASHTHPSGQVTYIDTDKVMSWLSEKPLLWEKAYLMCILAESGDRDLDLIAADVAVDLSESICNAQPPSAVYKNAEIGGAYAKY